MQVTKPNSDQLPAALFGAFPNGSPCLIAPAQVHLKEYEPCDFSLPSYQEVPDQSRWGVFLEDLSVGAKTVGQALAGASFHQQKPIEEDSSEAEPAPSKKTKTETVPRQQAQIEEDSADSSDDEPAPLKKPKAANSSQNKQTPPKKATTVTIPLTSDPRVALATAAAFAISGAAGCLAKQCDHRRKAALEQRARTKEDRIEAAEFHVAKAEIQHKNTASANRDAQSVMKEQHQFLGTQLKIQADTQLAAHMAQLETRRQVQKDCGQFRLEQEAMQRETELAFQEQNAKGAATNARCFENNQQLLMHIVDRFMDDRKETRQADLVREERQQEWLARSQGSAFALAAKTLERIPIHSSPPSEQDIAESLSQKITRIEDALSQKIFWCPLAAHRGMGITVYDLLTKNDRFKRIPAIEQQLTQGVKAYIEDCAAKGEEISFEHLLAVMLPCPRKSSWRVWDFVLSVVELFSRRERPSLEGAPLFSFTLDVFTTHSELSIEESRELLKEILRLYTPYGDKNLYKGGKYGSSKP